MVSLQRGESGRGRERKMRCLFRNDCSESRTDEKTLGDLQINYQRGFYRRGHRSASKNLEADDFGNDIF